MVSTRSHPSTFPPPTASPTKALSRSTRDTTAESSSPPPPSTPSSSGSPAMPKTKGSRSAIWNHTPSNLTLLWLVVSLPLVFWDTGYVLMRPHTMPGGYLHSPIWKPYALYGTVDYIYGFKAFNARNGFTSAQGVLNLVESALYMVYLWIVWSSGQDEEKVEGRGAPSIKKVGWFGATRSVGGKAGGLAVLIAFTAAALTVSKTVLYWLNEYFSGFDNIGHNDITSLIFLWIIPNGMWLVFPTHMLYVMGAEILEGLAIASGASKPGKPIKTYLALKDD